MHRHLMAIGTTLAAVAGMMPSAGAIRGWDWSEPVNIGGMIDTEFDDSGPAISKDGRVLYFQTNGPPGGPTATSGSPNERASITNGTGQRGWTP